MPIYEYRCQSCAHELEKLQRMTDEPLLDCPECGQPALRRLVSAAAFRLKGSGWYETDFKKDNKRNLAAPAGTDSAEPAPAAAEKAEARTASDGGEPQGKPKAADKPEAKAADKPVNKPASGPAAT